MKYLYWTISGIISLWMWIAIIMVSVLLFGCNNANPTAPEPIEITPRPAAHNALDTLKVSSRFLELVASGQAGSDPIYYAQTTAGQIIVLERIE